MPPGRTIKKNISWTAGIISEVVRLLILGLAAYFLLLAAWNVFSEMFAGNYLLILPQSEYRMGIVSRIICGLGLGAISVIGCPYAFYKLFEGILRLYKKVKAIPEIAQEH